MNSLWSIIHKYIDRLSIPGNGKNRLQRYGFVIILTAIFFLVKATLAIILGKDVPFLFALLIVILSAWFGGYRPGLFATVLNGILIYYFFLEPKYTFFGGANRANFITILLFCMEGSFISLLSESHKRSDIKRAEFISVISHELKNPLTSIKGYAEMIQRLASKESNTKSSQRKSAEFAQRIDQQIKQVIEMINEMLDITRIETGRLTYQDETFNIADLVKEIVSDQQVTTRTHKIYFKPFGDKLIVGDRYRIGQVITNLISNAIKYSPKAKKVSVTVESKRSGVIVAVSDSGPGITKEDQAKLFEPFFRAKNTQSAKGTGIGLFISDQIVKRHSGKLWVKSKPGRGSVFYLWLPVKQAGAR